jgi:hypothetical protein
MSTEPFHQSGKPQEIRDADKRPPLPDDDLRIGCDRIRPLRRDRAHVVLVDTQQEPRAVPVVPLAYAHELSPAERVERVHHTHKTRHCVRRGCILS